MQFHSFNPPLNLLEAEIFTLHKTNSGFQSGSLSLHKEKLGKGT